MLVVPYGIELSATKHPVAGWPAGVSSLSGVVFTDLSGETDRRQRVCALSITYTCVDREHFRPRQPWLADNVEQFRCAVTLPKLQLAFSDAKNVCQSSQANPLGQ